MKFSSRFPFFLAILLLSGGCASMVGRSSHPVAIGSTPLGAKVIVTNKKGSEVYQGTTPTVVNLRSGAGLFAKESYQVKLSKDGFEEKIVPLECKLNEWFAGTILAGGTSTVFKLKTGVIHEHLSATTSTESMNTNPVSLPDSSGNDVIFVNGFRFGFSRSRAPRFQKKLRDKYWNNVNHGFTHEVNQYFNENENENHFVNGSFWKGSMAKDREAAGYFKGMKMVKSGEIQASKKNNLITIVMHSQGNAYGVGIADGIIDQAKIQGANANVLVNLVFLSVHQPGGLKINEGMKRHGIQFTYLNDNAKIVSPMGKMPEVEDANFENQNWKEQGLKAHSATVDDTIAFEAIKKINDEKKIFTISNKVSAKVN